MNFPFPPLKLPNRGREEYSKIIHFIPSSQTRPERGLLPLSKIQTKCPF